jgi:hypothetical protein
VSVNRDLWSAIGARLEDPRLPDPIASFQVEHGGVYPLGKKVRRAPAIERSCDGCGAVMATHNALRRFCTAACANRMRHRAALLEGQA